MIKIKILSIKKAIIKYTLSYQQNNMVSVSIEYPVLKSCKTYLKKSIKAVNYYFRKKAYGLSAYAKKTLYKNAVDQYKYAQSQGFPFNEYSLVQVYKITYNQVPFLSLYYDIYQYTGGAHGNTERFGFTWNLIKNRKVMMADLFINKYNYKQTMLKVIKVEAHNRQKKGLVNYFDSLNTNIVKYFNEKNYYLTSKGIAVFYPLYSIAPYSEGIQVFIAPYKVFNKKIKYNL